MNFYIVMSLVALITDYCSTQPTQEEPVHSVKEDKPSNPKEPESSPSLEPWDSNPVYFLWTYKPGTHSLSNGNEARRVVFRQPHSLTRIAKTLTYGFDPVFHKDYFEPFERRPKPVTLVGIRKNGIFPRASVNFAAQSSEVAELQSPYNDVSNFWINEPNNL